MSKKTVESFVKKYVIQPLVNNANNIINKISNAGDEQRNNSSEGKTIDLSANTNEQNIQPDPEDERLFNQEQQRLSRRKEWLTFLNMEMNSEQGVLGLLNCIVSSASFAERVTYLEYYRRKMDRIAGTYNEKFPENNKRTPEELFSPCTANEYEVIYRNLLKLEDEIRFLTDETADFNKVVDTIQRNLREDISEAFVCGISEYYDELFRTIEQKTDQISDQEKV